MLSAAMRQKQQEQGERSRFWDQRGTGSRAFAIRRLKRAAYWSRGGGLGLEGWAPTKVGVRGRMDLVTVCVGSIRVWGGRALGVSEGWKCGLQGDQRKQNTGKLKRSGLGL